MAGEGSGRYSPGVIAELLNITPRRLQQLAAEGIVPRQSRGLYDLRACVAGYVRFLQEQAKGRAPAREEKEVDLLLRKERERGLRLANDEREGRAVRLEEVAVAASAWLTVITSMMEGWAGRLAAKLAATTDAATVRAILKDETRRARAKAALELQALAGDPDAGSADAPAARKNAGPVGRSKPRAAARKRRAGGVAQQ